MRENNPQRFAYTAATVLLRTLLRPLKLHRLKGQVAEVRSELVSTPRKRPGSPAAEEANLSKKEFVFLGKNSS
ncbi:hypothetical protein EYF80_064431 [Liparis tanakae]|uniref:Uncharacterized protein n=1 Tax=Liparis tanakae TaxID=230148 RepID=A0A4Z2E9F7_9TELE|nr:hypothetical protein EYF80_064431 [Liparis tanakae]